MIITYCYKMAHKQSALSKIVIDQQRKSKLSSILKSPKISNDDEISDDESIHMSSKKAIEESKCIQNVEDQELNVWTKQLEGLSQTLHDSLAEAKRIVYIEIKPNSDTIIENSLEKLKTEGLAKDEVNYHMFKLLSTIIENSPLPLKELGNKCYEYLKQIWVGCPPVAQVFN